MVIVSVTPLPAASREAITQRSVVIFFFFFCVYRCSIMNIAIRLS